MDYAQLLASRDALQEVVDKAHERLDNIVAANAIPMPSGIQLQALKECTQALRDELQPHISYDPL